jgi:RimJ/RimL family protein N-acetyltransferase
MVGSTGISFESADLASTGYVFARDAWGLGYASETLRAMMSLAQSLGVRWLYGLCHVEHHASAHVMEKCGFSPEGVLQRHIAFPNISPLRADVLRYGIIFDAAPRHRL